MAHVTVTYMHNVYETYILHRIEYSGIIAYFSSQTQFRPTYGFLTKSRYKTDYSTINDDLLALNLDGLNARTMFHTLHSSLADSMASNTIISFFKVKRNNPSALICGNDQLNKRKHSLFGKKRCSLS